MKRIKQEEENTPRKKLARIVRISAAMLLVLLFLEIWAVNRLATYGDQIQEIQNAKMSLQLENQVLENQIAENSSLVTVETKAASLGFNQIKSWDYLKPANLAAAY